MPLALVSLLFVSCGLVILGWAAFALMGWSHGRERSLPMDGRDSADERLAKAGLDATFGGLPVLASGAVQFVALEGAGSLDEAHVAAAAGAVLAYLVAYFWFVRPRMARHRVGLRARALASGPAAAP